MSAAEEDARRWREQRRRGSIAPSARTASAPAVALPVQQAARSIHNLAVDDGVLFVGKDQAAAEVLFAELANGFGDRLMDLKGSHAVADEMHGLRKSVKAELTNQCARTTKIGDVLKIVTKFVDDVHRLTTKQAEAQLQLYSEATESVLTDGPARLHNLLNGVVNRQVTAKTEAAFRHEERVKRHDADGGGAKTVAEALAEKAYWMEQAKETEHKVRSQFEQTVLHLSAQIRRLESELKEQKEARTLAEANLSKFAASSAEKTERLQSLFDYQASEFELAEQRKIAAEKARVHFERQSMNDAKALQKVKKQLAKAENLLAEEKSKTLQLRERQELVLKQAVGMFAHPKRMQTPDKDQPPPTTTTPTTTTCSEDDELRLEFDFGPDAALRVNLADAHLSLTPRSAVSARAHGCDTSCAWVRIITACSEVWLEVPARRPGRAAAPLLCPANAMAWTST